MPIRQRLDITTEPDIPTTTDRPSEKSWEQRARDFDDWCAFAGKATHQVGLLVVMWVGMLVAVVSTTVVSCLGVAELWKRLTQ